MAKQKRVPREPKDRSPHMRGKQAKEIIQKVAEGTYFLVAWRFDVAADIFEKVAEMCLREDDRVDRTPTP